MAITESSSRFKFTDLIEVATPNGTVVETYGIWAQPSFIADPNTRYTKYIVPNNRAGRIDKISDDLYGTSEYFWVLIAANKPLDPLNWPQVGDIIYVPDFSSIVSEM